MGALTPALFQRRGDISTLPGTSSWAGEAEVAQKRVLPPRLASYSA